MAARSLMDFLDAPVLVGDPDGRAVYANPAFEREFQTRQEEVSGVPLANLFEGGGREALLLAVAQVCEREDSARVRLRVSERGYVAVASPVEAEGGRVGVILLLLEESASAASLQTLRHELLTPLDEVNACLNTLGEQAGDGALATVADGVRAIERMRKWADSVAVRLTEADPEG